jgi:hypothetical protein
MPWSSRRPRGRVRWRALTLALACWWGFPMGVVIASSVATMVVPASEHGITSRVRQSLEGPSEARRVQEGPDKGDDQPKQERHGRRLEGPLTHCRTPTVSNEQMQQGGTVRRPSGQAWRRRCPSPSSAEDEPSVAMTSRCWPNTGRTRWRTSSRAAASRCWSSSGPSTSRGAADAGPGRRCPRDGLTRRVTEDLVPGPRQGRPVRASGGEEMRSEACEIRSHPKGVMAHSPGAGTIKEFS